MRSTELRTERRGRSRFIDGDPADAAVYQRGVQFGIDRRTVGTILKRNDVATREAGLFPTQIDEAAELYASRWPLARIAQAGGCDADDGAQAVGSVE